MITRSCHSGHPKEIYLSSRSLLPPHGPRHPIPSASPIGHREQTADITLSGPGGRPRTTENGARGFGSPAGFNPVLAQLRQGLGQDLDLRGLADEGVPHHLGGTQRCEASRGIDSARFRGILIECCGPGMPQMVEASKKMCCEIL